MKNHQYAFTLIELLLVLTLIVIILGLAMPGLGRLYARQQLKGTVQQFQSVLYQTRLDAMKNGETLVLRCRFGTSAFEIVLKTMFDQRNQAQEGIGKTSSFFYERTLADDVIFNREESGSTFIEKNGMFTESNVWSPPIYFFPNGRTSSAVFELQSTGRYELTQQLSLRGLTGTASLRE